MSLAIITFVSGIFIFLASVFGFWEDSWSVYDRITGSGSDATAFQSDSSIQISGDVSGNTVIQSGGGDVHLNQPVPGGGKVELVDVAVIERRMSEIQEPKLHEMDEILDCAGPTCPDVMSFPHIDVKVRNTSDEPIILKEARFRVHDRLELIPCEAPYFPLPPSFEYEMVLNPQKVPPYTESLRISQAVPPKGVDRFQFSVAEDSIYGAGLYLVTLVLVYNEAGNELTSEQMLVAVPSTGRPWFPWSSYFDCYGDPAYLESIESFLDAPAVRYSAIDEIQELAIEAEEASRR